MNPIAIDLGIVTIYWYSIIMFVAMIIGFYFVQKEARNFDIPNNFISDLGFYTIVFGLIGARLYYVAFNWSYYSNNLLDILKVWEGGLAIHGAIIAGLIFITIYTKKYKLKTLRILDMIVVGLIIGQAIGRWGN
ncbi:MAG: prolipoprotein diacylglyceryl transferase, partial [Bacilli bacterium]|nr:prolipoprotein diacylglyceryl transferase [Bacilli bacterium]